MIRIDLHMHTTFSGDAKISPKFLVDQLYTHLFVKGVAVTDHDTLDGYVQASRFAMAYEDILIIPGIEVSTRQGHVTILGIQEKPAYLLPIEDLIDFARERDGIIVIPHPYRKFDGIGNIAENIQADAIEILNPHATTKENKMAEALAKARSLPGVAGSDAHEPREMWAAYTEVEAELNVDDALNVIKRGKVKATSSKL